MNDFDYEVMQKKRIANGARKKVNGSKSKRCSLPSDNLTPAEIKKRSGPCMVYKLSAPMDWATFKAMPADLQRDYINNLQSRFNVGLAVISVEMFGVGKTALAQHLKAHGITSHVGGKRLSAAERTMWDGFLGHNSEENVTEEQKPVDCAPPHGHAGVDIIHGDNQCGVGWRVHRSRVHRATHPAADPRREGEN